MRNETWKKQNIMNSHIIRMNGATLTGYLGQITLRRNVIGWLNVRVVELVGMVITGQQANIFPQIRNINMLLW